MRRLAPVLLALLLGAWPVLAQPGALPPKEKFHLFLLVGQSNMAGRGAVTAADREPLHL